MPPGTGRTCSILPVPVHVLHSCSSCKAQLRSHLLQEAFWTPLCGAIAFPLLSTALTAFVLSPRCPVSFRGQGRGCPGASAPPGGLEETMGGGCLWRGGRGLPGVAGGSEAPCCSLASLMPRRPGSWWGGASVFLLHLVCPQRRPATFPPLPREGWESGGAVGCRAQTEPQGV